MRNWKQLGRGEDGLYMYASRETGLRILPGSSEGLGSDLGSLVANHEASEHAHELPRTWDVR